LYSELNKILIPAGIMSLANITIKLLSSGILLVLQSQNPLASCASYKFLSP